MPLNISDSDLSPAMTEPPLEKEAATEMLFCGLRYEVAECLRRASWARHRENEVEQFGGPDTIAEKDRDIDALEIVFEQKFIRYCDPSIPLHLLSIFLSKSVICTMRLMAHHPRQYPDKGASMPQTEKDMLFSESVKALEIAATGHTNKLIQCFQWHTHVHFQLDVFIYVLSELRRRQPSDQVNHAWQLVETSFENRPEMLNDTKNSLYYAIGNLTLKAWDKRVAAAGLYPNMPQPIIPRFVSVLRTQRKLTPASTTPQPSHNWRSNLPTSGPQPVTEFVPNPLTTGNNFNMTAEQWKTMDFGLGDMTMIEPSPHDWEYWQTLMDGDLPIYAGNPTTWNQLQQ